jgi:hypothetical protein
VTQLAAHVQYFGRFGSSESETFKKWSEFKRPLSIGTITPPQPARILLEIGVKWQKYQLNNSG